MIKKWLIVVMSAVLFAGLAPLSASAVEVPPTPDDPHSSCGAGVLCW